MCPHTRNLLFFYIPIIKSVISGNFLNSNYFPDFSSCANLYCNALPLIEYELF